jgi:hypothetical protein
MTAIFPGCSCVKVEFLFGRLLGAVLLFAFIWLSGCICLLELAIRSQFIEDGGVVFLIHFLSTSTLT